MNPVGIADHGMEDSVEVELDSVLTKLDWTVPVVTTGLLLESTPFTECSPMVVTVKAVMPVGDSCGAEATVVVLGWKLKGEEAYVVEGDICTGKLFAVEIADCKDDESESEEFDVVVVTSTLGAKDVKKPLVFSRLVSCPVCSLPSTDVFIRELNVVSSTVVL